MAPDIIPPYEPRLNHLNMALDHTHMNPTRWDIYPVVLYLTPAAGPTVTEDVSYQFGALNNREEALTTLRTLAEQMCTRKGWSMVYRETQNMLYYDMFAITAGSVSVAVSRMVAEFWRKRAILMQGNGVMGANGHEKQEQRDVSVLVGRFSAERVCWTTSREDVCRALVDDFVQRNLGT